MSQSLFFKKENPRFLQQLLFFLKRKYSLPDANELIKLNNKIENGLNKF